jgi:hypothetical protein
MSCASLPTGRAASCQATWLGVRHDRTGRTTLPLLTLACTVGNTPRLIKTGTLLGTNDLSLPPLNLLGVCRSSGLKRAPARTRAAVTARLCRLVHFRRTRAPQRVCEGRSYPLLDYRST